MKRREAAAKGRGQADLFDPQFKEEFPLLYGHMVDLLYDDGKPRETSTLLLFVEDGRLKGCLKDRDLDETAWASSDSIAGLLAAFEKGLADETLEWRKAQKWKGKKG